MRVEECVKKLKSKGIIDSREIYIYASLKNIIGGMVGSIRGLVLLCIYEDILYIYRAKSDNSYGEQLEKIHIPDMKNIRGKAGIFGGKFSFNYDRKEYKFKLPAKAEKFVDFFVK